MSEIAGRKPLTNWHGVLEDLEDLFGVPTSGMYSSLGHSVYLCRIFYIVYRSKNYMVEKPRYRT